MHNSLLYHRDNSASDSFLFSCPHIVPSIRDHNHDIVKQPCVTLENVMAVSFSLFEDAKYS